MGGKGDPEPKAIPIIMIVRQSTLMSALHLTAAEERTLRKVSERGQISASDVKGDLANESFGMPIEMRFAP